MCKTSFKNWSEFSKATWFMSIYKIQLYFYILEMNSWKQNIYFKDAIYDSTYKHGIPHYRYSKCMLIVTKHWCNWSKKRQGGSDGKESAFNAGDLGLIPGLGRFSGGGHGNPLQYCCLENLHGQRTLASYSPWGCKELDTTEWLSTSQIINWNSLMLFLCQFLPKSSIDSTKSQSRHHQIFIKISINRFRNLYGNAKEP